MKSAAFFTTHFALDLFRRNVGSSSLLNSNLFIDLDFLLIEIVERVVLK